VDPRARERVTASVVAAVFLLVGVWICVEALQVPFGSLRMPGAGFFPLVLGVVLGALAVILFGTDLASPAAGSTRIWPERREVLYVLASLIAAVWLFDRAGFLLTMALFLGVSIKVLGHMSWLTTVVVAVVGSVTAFWVFGRLLQINLPGGLLRF
jgi:putative tricarboxylic transport membrane protein